MVYQRKPFGPILGPDLLRKKSRSTVSWPIFSYSGASRALSMITAIDGAIIALSDGLPTSASHPL